MVAAVNLVQELEMYPTSQSPGELNNSKVSLLILCMYGLSAFMCYQIVSSTVGDHDQPTANLTSTIDISIISVYSFCFNLFPYTTLSADRY